MHLALPLHAALAQGAPAWVDYALLALVALGLVVGLVLVAGLWLLMDRLARFEARAARLDVLPGIQTQLARLAGERGDLDLRRLEHVLVDIRDEQRRVEDQLLRAAESAARAGAGGGAAPEELKERITNRLLAMGYERVLVLGEHDAIQALVTDEGTVAIEAHRQGVLHKGRVHVRAGRIADVELVPSYSVFP